MQTNIGSLVVFNVDSNLGTPSQPIAFTRLIPFKVSPDEVIGPACGNPLSELPAVVGRKHPARLLIARTADLNFHAIQGAVFGTPDRAKNQGIGFFGFLLRSRCWTHSDGSSKTKQQRNQEQSASNAGKQR